MQKARVLDSSLKNESECWSSLIEIQQRKAATQSEMKAKVVDSSLDSVSESKATLIADQQRKAATQREAL